MKQLFRLYRYAKPYKFLLVIGFMLIVLDGLMGTVMPLVTKFVIDDILWSFDTVRPAAPEDEAFGERQDDAAAQVGPGRSPGEQDHDRPDDELTGAANPPDGRLIRKSRFGRTVELSPSDWLLAVLVFILAFNAVAGIISYIRTFLMTWTSNRIVFDMRNDVFQHLQELSMRFFDTQGTGQIMQRMTGDVGNLSGLITGTTINVFRDIIMMMWMLVILFNVNWVLTLLALAILPPYVLTNQLFVRRLKRIWRLLWQKWGDIYGTLYEAVAGAKVVKAFGQEKREERRAFHSMRQTYQYQIRAATLSTAMGSILGLLQQTGAALVLWWGGRLVLRDFGVEEGFTLGSMMLFQQYLWRMYGPIMNLVHVNTQLQSALVSSERVFGLMDSQPTVEEKEDAEPMPAVDGHVEFRDVHFSYDPEKPVLRGISFKVKPDSMIALVGPSGCGKTTVINLVSRFYDPVDGAILVDDIDIRDVQVRSLRDQMGVVMQESILFKGSVADNVRYGRPEASDQDVVRAAIDANAHKFIVEDLSEGYETDVGERGGRLSGGQRQRINIARTILRNPRLLILDEATSSLDTESEAAIQEALERLMEGRTTFVIAHRLSTVMAADRIIVMKDGRIEEMGSHTELVEQGGMYADMYKKQFRVKDMNDAWLK